MTEPVIARIGKGMAVTVEHRLADVLLMESPATPASFAGLFARLPGFAMAMASSPAGKIVLGLRGGTMLTLHPVHGVGNGSVPEPVLRNIARSLYLQLARCRWTLRMAGGHLEWNPEPGSRYVVTVGAWYGGGAFGSGEPVEFPYPFPQPGGMR